MARSIQVAMFKPIMIAVLFFVGCMWFLYGVKSILLPFVFALVLAYFLAPLMAFLERWSKFSRTTATVVVLCLLLLFIAIISFTIFPVVYKQISLLVSKVLQQKEHIANTIPILSSWLEELQPDIGNKIKTVVSDLSHEVLTFTGNILKNILQSGFQTINIISLIFITPIVLFYTLRDWNKIVHSFQRLIPRKFGLITKKLFNEIDYTLSGYVRGQTSVCILLGLFYAIGLSVIGLESGFALGMISGLLTFIPYAGAVFSSVLCMLIGLIQFGAVKPILMILALFIVGQFLEGHFIVPRFIGKNVNLHPVWIIFGLLAGGALMGFVGVLIALPLTAIVGVVIRFILSYYYKSKIYS